MDQQPQLTEQETLSKITPHAFRVAPQLLDTPLARPWRRAVAMLIDLFLISSAASLLSAAWAIPILGLLWLIKESLNGVTKRIALIATFLAITVLAGIFANDEGDQSDSESKQSLSQNVELLSHLSDFIALGLCKDSDCAEQEAIALKQALADSNDLTATEQYQALKHALNESVLVPADIERILGPEPAPEVAATTESAESSTSIGTKEINSDSEHTDEDSAEKETKHEGEATVASINSCEKPLSPLAMIKGVITDLGLGFSWAIAYFSILTAWFNGQTIGKRLAHIRVVRLDGKELTLWGCFGRYGGYSAGLATGLLGFLQIYWDPNRQAIQDKISSTAVIYCNQKRLS